MTVTIQATSPGIATATVTIAAKAVNLRPQVGVWEREVPAGPGITGLWRPVPQPGAATGLAAMFLGGTDSVYTFRQEGGNFGGTVEGGNISFFGGNDVPVPVTDGKVEGNRVSFKAGRNSYSGTITGDRLEFQRTFDLGFEFPKAVERRPVRPQWASARWVRPFDQSVLADPIEHPHWC